MAGRRRRRRKISPKVENGLLLVTIKRKPALPLEESKERAGSGSSDACFALTKEAPAHNQRVLPSLGRCERLGPPADALACTPVYAVNEQQIEPAFRSSPSACLQPRRYA
jgi:hypothetical protein